MLTAAGFMLCVAFFADKIPALDSLWDGVHVFIRIPAGVAVGVLWPAFAHPLIFLGPLGVFLLFMVWLRLPRV